MKPPSGARPPGEDREGGGPSPAHELESRARSQVRGSSLLLSGRLLSLGMKFATQLLLVRHLSTADYGAWTYALSAVAVFQSAALLGLHRAVPRFLPIYDEREDHGRFFGTLAMVVGTVLAAGTLVAAGVHLFPEAVGRLAGGNGEPLAVLLVLVFMVPLEALDELLTGTYAAFSRPGAIFFRRYGLSPALRLTAVLVLALLGRDVVFLARGYLAASLLGVLVYLALLVPLLREEGLLRHLRPGRLRMPFREVFGYTLPLMSSDLVGALMTAAGPLLLGYHRGMSEVALFRVVVPVATLNLLVMQSFALLYTPTASRLHARGDREGIEHLYWRTATWIAVLTFPVFAVTFSAAGPVTVLLYGARYEAAATVLSLLAAGYYFNAALGFNSLTLKVVGKVREVVAIDVAAAVVAVGLNVVLVPRHGAPGAAVATACSLVAHNLLKQAGLRLAVGVSFFDRRFAGVYGRVAAGCLALLGSVLAAPGTFQARGTAAVLVSLAVLLAVKRRLGIAETFPELARLRGVRWLIS